MSDNSGKLCIDLCCGKKGLSQAFADAGWTMLTVDIDPRFNPTLIADITKVKWETWEHDPILNLSRFKERVLLASPP